jgi:O-antigen/teichoic acid export membrane protein
MEETHRSSWSLSDLTHATMLRYAAQAVGLLSNLLLTPFLLRELGKSDYGLWLLMMSLVSLLYFLELGMSDSLVRTIAAHRASGTLIEARPVVANGLLLSIGVASVTTLLVVTNQRALLRVVTVTSDQEAAFSSLIFAGLVLFWAGLLAGIPDAVLLSTKHFARSNVIDVGAAVANAGLTWAAVGLGHGLVGLAGVTAATSCLSTTLKLLSVHRAVPELSPSLRHISWTHEAWRPLSKPLAWTSLIYLADIVSYHFDLLVVGSLLSTSVVAALSIAFRIPSILMAFARTAFSTLFPYSADLYGRSDIAGLRRSLLLSTRIALMLTLLGLIVFWYAGPMLLELWVGPIEQGTILLRLGLILNVVFNGFIAVEMILYGCGDVRSLATINVAGAFVNLPLTIVLVRSIGVAGPLLATIAGGILVSSLSASRAARLVNLSVGEFCRAAVLWPLAALGPVVIVALILETMQVEQDGILLGATVVAASAYVAVGVFSAFAHEERVQALGVALAISRRVVWLCDEQRRRFARR